MIKVLTLSLKAELLDCAQSVLERFQGNRLTRVPLLYLGELPSISGVYFAATEDGQILYIGKADNFTHRCKISTHHKLSSAIEKGAVYLYVASIESRSAWYVEQWLIDAISPPLNKVVSRWWVEPELKPVTPTSLKATSLEPFAGARVLWKLREVLARRKITNNALAEKIGLHPVNISRLKSRNTLPAIGSEAIERFRVAITELSRETFGVCTLSELIELEEDPIDTLLTYRSGRA